MNAHRFTLRPLGSWATPWHADTIWGSLCWAWREVAGQRSLEELLDRYQSAGESRTAPPFVLSDAFPAGLLPFPAGASPPRQPGVKVKAAWCRVEDFAVWANGCAGPLEAPADRQRPFHTSGRLHAQLSRSSGTTAGVAEDGTESGQLFEMDETHFHREAFPQTEDRLLSVYVRADDADLTPLRACWEALTWKGFGKRSSVGLGAFEVVGPESPCSWLNIGDTHNGFMSLSHFVPSAGDPTDGFWRVLAKNPKFAVERVPLPFKGNLITLTPGSRFRTAAPPQGWYGRLLPMSRPDFPKAVHCGLTLAAPVRWTG